MMTVHEAQHCLYLGTNDRLRAVPGHLLRIPKVGNETAGRLCVQNRKELRVGKLFAIQAQLVRAENVV
jgi:hypothetical protein